MAHNIYQWICGKDNFAVLIHDPETNQTCAIDAPNGEEIHSALLLRNWPLTHILVTHRHYDHTSGIPYLAAHYPDLQVHGPVKEASRIGGITHAIEDKEVFSIGNLYIQAIETPGHTLGHMCYWLPKEELLFTGDTLFSLGCGRILEGSAEMMWQSLCKLKILPKTTRFFCGHEYTLANGQFALHIEPNNSALIQHMEEIKKRTSAGLPTLPSTLGCEQEINPFLRADHPAVQRSCGLEGESPEKVFAHLRYSKDHYR